MAALAIGASAGLIEGGAKQSALEFSAHQNELNAERADEQSAEVARAGSERMAMYTEKARKFAAASEAQIARKHIDLGSGLAKAIRQENERAASMDLLTMQNNVTNAVLSGKFKAEQLRLQAGFDRKAGDRALWTGLLSGTLRGAANSKYLQELGGEQDFDPLKHTPSAEGATLVTAPPNSMGSYS